MSQLFSGLGLQKWGVALTVEAVVTDRRNYVIYNDDSSFHLQFFRMTHAAQTTIMRFHTNDLVLNTLTDRMESEIEDRTNELAIAIEN